MAQKKMKTYRSLRHLGLLFHVTRKNGKREPIEFAGGTRAPRIVRGTFQTGDEEIQKILENHPRYNTDFKLIHEEENKKSEKGDSNKKKAKEVTGIANLQDAKNYLTTNFDDVKAEDVKTKDKVLEKAKELNLSFPDMKSE